MAYVLTLFRNTYGRNQFLEPLDLHAQRAVVPHWVFNAERLVEGEVQGSSTGDGHICAATEIFAFGL